eukprot:TRINITY_DN16690_c0_g1_i3.p1 TRINITY_DN16690_c0_g1~~TRINITY_DN16690_c0_g1_i3.p1  ORF type:complete len:236 (+),score=30.68 TRINITY_DN16690_c0_g1_i3:126-833(+)
MYKAVRSLRSLDRAAFSEDLQTVVSSPLTAEQLDARLRATLDSHAPVSRRRARPGKSAPWYPSVRTELRQAKQRRRRAERQWLKSGLTVHEHIFSVSKRAVTALVYKATSAFIRSQIAESDSSRQLFDICGRLCGRTKCSPLPTLYPLSQLPDVFCEYFMNKVATIRSELDQLPSHCDLNSTDIYDESVPSFSEFNPVSESDLNVIILKANPPPVPSIPSQLICSLTVLMYCYRL